ncbi:hypothetical protein SLUDD06_01322 [Streptococcus lutetiensis]|nr:hypothetical protein SLUDD06_01322 [Streptococcus lutetiensis]
MFFIKKWKGYFSPKVTSPNFLYLTVDVIGATVTCDNLLFLLEEDNTTTGLFLFVS